jgi:hypothetical protein
MKNLAIIILLTCFMISCSKDRENELEDYTGEWQLVKMSGQIPNSESTGTNMEWQEFYQIYSNGTFSKSREQDGGIIEESGSFSIEYNNYDEQLLILIYEADNSLIGSCYSSAQKEEFVLTSDSSMFSTWASCDGPGLEYERIK